MPNLKSQYWKFSWNNQLIIFPHESWGVFCTKSPFQPVESWEFGDVKKFYGVQLLQENLSLEISSLQSTKSLLLFSHLQRTVVWDFGKHLANKAFEALTLQVWGLKGDVSPTLCPCQALSGPSSYFGWDRNWEGRGFAFLLSGPSPLGEWVGGVFGNILLCPDCRCGEQMWWHQSCPLG